MKSNSKKIKTKIEVPPINIHRQFAEMINEHCEEREYGFCLVMFPLEPPTKTKKRQVLYGYSCDPDSIEDKEKILAFINNMRGE